MDARPPRTVVMVAYTYYPWDPRVRRESETLARMGRRVTVVCARNEDELPRESVRGVEVVRVPKPILRGGPWRYAFQYASFMLLAAAAVRTLRRTEDLAAVHTHSLPDFIAFAALGAKLRGIPLVLDLHEAMPEIIAARFPRARALYALALAAERLSCLIADRVIVVNETVRDLLESRGVPSERLVVVFNSPDATRVEGEALPSFPPGTLRLVYAGGVNSERDLATLIRAVERLRQSRPTVLAIYGPGPSDYRSYLQGLVDGLGLRGTVTIGNVLPSYSVLAYEALADVGVATYERNPHTEVALPTKGFEFVSLDKPLVLPNLRAMRRAFEGSALFYEPGNHVDLAEKVLQAASGGPEIEAMRARARVMYNATRWEVQAGRLAAAYADLGRPSSAVGGGPCT